VVKENQKFEQYYDGLLNLPEEEKKEFWAALRRELPNSFRFCGSKGFAATYYLVLRCHAYQVL
jgi:multisite-specific tRNA:(cytosine-C5)-methyltransferase